MTERPEDALGEDALDWTPEGPRSRRFGDIYFSPQDGLAESRAVFLQGCGLPEAWAGRERFVVGELGFGTGLNIAALAELWMRTSSPTARLHVFSIEAFPLTAEDASRALAAWPELAPLVGPLLAGWPGRARGLHRVEWPQARIILDLAVMDVETALRDWSGRADAWFLDGFSPALNPDMWRPQVLQLVADRSAPGARAATFTVAGAVRRGLAAAGFAVEKAPGFGRKRERLEARLEASATPSGPRPGEVVIIGAGIAGAAAARALRALGHAPRLLDAAGPGSGASGNPAALVTPRLDAGLGPVAALGAQAFNRAVALYEALPQAILGRGVLQLVQAERDADRFARIAAADLFEPDAMRLLTASEAGMRMDDAVPAALDQAQALTLDPAAVLAAWAAPVEIAAVARLERSASGWRLLDADGGLIAEAGTVIVAAGLETFGFGEPLRPVRGQVSWADLPCPAAAAWGGYVAPTRQGLVFGATHDRGDTDDDVRAHDHARNLATLAEALPGLAERLAAQPLGGRAAVRATTADRLPVAGAVDGAPGLFLLTGFGSRGFSFAPLLAEHVAALATGAPSPLPIELAELVDPGRFARRAARRNGRNSA